jgi:hypothetical protein
MKSATEAPMAASIQKLKRPFRAWVVIRMLTGPAMGMEKTKPTKRPTNDKVNNAIINGR